MYSAVHVNSFNTCTVQYRFLRTLKTERSAGALVKFFWGAVGIGEGF